MLEEKAGSSVKSVQVALDILEAISESRDDVGILSSPAGWALQRVLCFATSKR